LREDPDARKHQDDEADGNRRWWVYGIVLGAAAIAGGAIVVSGLSDDHQRIEVTLP
jgi:hypothetical protein